MPVVHVVPTKRGMQHEEIVGRVQGGWQLLGRQAVQIGTGVATPANPDGARVEDADVWMLAEPMVPMAMVAGLLLEAAQEYSSGDAISATDALECLCKDLFGTDLPGLREAFKNAQEPDPSGD